ncbi:MAG: hypothetical protein CMH63_00135 [Nanoarchaeota archaeon]|jgi:hypothetical protein|nr:hypothetical protein [Nanoarchaeota archaeon]|tara:strand:- start:44154 stop:44384 length:231 start_codon:yes stop_codon:yes gene_type:complete
MKLWFKNRRFGIGWYPCSWEGWAVIGVYLVLMGFLVKNYLVKMNTSEYIFAVVVLTGLLIVVSYKKGEQLDWRIWK